VGVREISVQEPEERRDVASLAWLLAAMSMPNELTLACSVVYSLVFFFFVLFSFAWLYSFLVIRHIIRSFRAAVSRSVLLLPLPSLTGTKVIQPQT